MKAQFLLAASLVAVFCAACSSAKSDDGDEPAAEGALRTEGNAGKEIARGLFAPGDITEANGKIYFNDVHTFATQEESESHTNLFVYDGRNDAKQIIKGAYGAFWDLAISGSDLFVINEGYASVVKYPITGASGRDNDGTTIYHQTDGADGEEVGSGVTRVAVLGNRLIVGLYNGDVVSLDKSGGDKKVVAKTRGGQIRDLHVNKDRFFAANGEGEIWTGKADGSEEAQRIAKGYRFVYSLTSNATTLFWAADDASHQGSAGAFSAPLDHLTQTQSVLPNDEKVTAIAASDTKIYWGSKKDHALKSREVAANAQPKTLVTYPAVANADDDPQHPTELQVTSLGLVIATVKNTRAPQREQDQTDEGVLYNIDARVYVRPLD
jgi:hypothetical protein